MKRNRLFAALVLWICVTLSACQFSFGGPPRGDTEPPDSQGQGYTLDTLPEYAGEAYVPLYNNVPDFDPDDLPARSFETYSDLDALGRCGVAYANVGLDLMPTEKRGSIGQVKPSGWHTVQYDNVDGKYLYNRCHLIGYQLTAENANKRNLITGTRYLNVQGMLPFENLAADYIKETGNHVLYRVTPVFEGDNLVAGGVQIEAMSVEDRGEGVLFNVYCYNVQPGIVIDYATGESVLADEPDAAGGESTLYILNTNSKKFHLPDCSSAINMKANVRQEYAGTRETLIAEGYEPCGRCKP
ncbi:MAG: DNA/RNA non-specific endonuclease [Oscillibacter sp.]|nr:DNA/RNA non-specific endonuclease [Oscillibacter sp.]